jgi:uncharacterized protein YndB with AHSA1/START domain
MPTVTRSRTVETAADDVWRLVADPERLPTWWPGVQRVEDATPEAWTVVLGSPKGKTVRADYTRVEAEPPRRAVWRHEVAESPFERILSESLTEIVLEPQTAGGTRVSLTARHRPRGLARFGSFQLRRAAARQLEDALDGLELTLPGRKA